MAMGQPVWHREVLPVGWEQAAADLAARSVLDGFFLAGGTGLALHAGHRRSVDLDLFSRTDFDPARIQGALQGLPNLRVTQAAPGTLHLEVHGILVSFLHYPYPLLFPLTRFERLDVADPRDIACMKVSAIASRGTRRDFVDLYLAASEYGLKDILSWFERMFQHAPFNRIHVLKSLVYFADAEAQPMPDMLLPLDWRTVREFFESATPSLLSDTR